MYIIVIVIYIYTYAYYIHGGRHDLVVMVIYTTENCIIYKKKNIIKLMFVKTVDLS